MCSTWPREGRGERGTAQARLGREDKKADLIAMKFYFNSITQEKKTAETKTGATHLEGRGRVGPREGGCTPSPTRILDECRDGASRPGGVKESGWLEGVTTHRHPYILGHFLFVSSVILMFILSVAQQGKLIVLAVKISWVRR